MIDYRAVMLHMLHDSCTSASEATLDMCQATLIARFMGPTWGPPGAGRTQVGPMLAPWTLLSGHRYAKRICRFHGLLKIPGTETSISSFKSTILFENKGTIKSQMINSRTSLGDVMPWKRLLHHWRFMVRTLVDSSHNWPNKAVIEIPFVIGRAKQMN